MSPLSAGLRNFAEEKFMRANSRVERSGRQGSCVTKREDPFLRADKVVKVQQKSEQSGSVTPCMLQRDDS